MTAIHTERLSKRCGSTLALDSLDPSSRARCTASSDRTARGMLDLTMLAIAALATAIAVVVFEGAI